MWTQLKQRNVVPPAHLPSTSISHSNMTLTQHTVLAVVPEKVVVARVDQVPSASHNFISRKGGIVRTQNRHAFRIGSADEKVVQRGFNHLSVVKLSRTCEQRRRKR